MSQTVNVSIQGHRHPTQNSDIYSLYYDPNVGDDIKIRGLGRADHTLRAEDDRIAKKFLNGKFNNTMSVGRTRRADVVQTEALQVLRIRGWRRRAGDRKEWRRFLGEAMAQKGPQRHTWVDGQ